MKLDRHSFPLFLLLIVIFIAGTGIGYVFSVNPNSTFTISSGIYSGAPSYTIYNEDSTYYAKNAYGYIEFSGTGLSIIIQKAINDTDYGTVFVKAMGEPEIGIDLTSKITMKHRVHLYFEEGGLYNIKFAGDAFYLLGTEYGADFNIYLGSSFRLYNYGSSQCLVHLYNNLYSKVYVFGVGYGNETGVLSTATGVLVDGTLTVGAYYNQIEVLLAYRIGIAIHLPYNEVGANANLIKFLQISKCDYGVKIDWQCGDNVIYDVVVTGGGVKYGAVWINGVSNHVTNLYGEYSSGEYGGALLYIGSNATLNLVEYVCQEGTGGLVSRFDVGLNSKNIIGGKTGTYITVNSGSVTFSSQTSKTVTHGLAGTPTCIIITPASVVSSFHYVTTVGNTTFTITSLIEFSGNVYWYAEYKP